MKSVVFQKSPCRKICTKEHENFNRKIPLHPPFSKGDLISSPLCKRGVRGDFLKMHFPNNGNSRKKNIII